jgi:outer membrane protein
MKKVMISKYVGWFVATLLTFQVSAQNETLFSLERCIELAIANNEIMRNSKLDVQASEYKIKEAESGLLPTINVNNQLLYYSQLPGQYVPANSFGGPEGQYTKITMGVPQSTTMNLQVSQSLFNQSVMIGLKTARVFKEVSRLQENLTKEDIIYNVATTYYSIQVLQDNLSRTKDNISNLEKTVLINESLKNNNLVSDNAQNRLLINLENLKNEYENQKLAKAKYLTLLKYLMNISSDEEFAIEDFNYEGAIQTLETVDLKDRNDIQLQQLNIRLAEFDKKFTKAGYYPVSSIGFNYGIAGYNDELAPGKVLNDDWIKSTSFSLSLRIPLFDGFQKHYKIKQQEIAIRKNQNSLSMMEAGAQRELQDAINNYNTNSNQFLNSKKSLDLAEQLFRSSQSEFENGITSTTELLNAQTDLTNARTNFSTAQLNLKLAELSWKRATGRLSQEFE